MRPIKVAPTRPDIAIAKQVAATTGPIREEVSRGLSWGADEHVLIALSGTWWIYCFIRGHHQRARIHLFLLLAASAAVPHLAKRMFDQTRPDRLTARGYWRSVPLSGRKLDSFPSGHAVHMAALASAANTFPPKWRDASWAAAGVLCSVRALLLAHWASDFAAGFALGVGIDRLVRRLTGFGRDGSNGNRPR
jgi:membrane-associated phospholipid phosphatase